MIWLDEEVSVAGHRLGSRVMETKCRRGRSRRCVIYRDEGNWTHLRVSWRTQDGPLRFFRTCSLNHDRELVGQDLSARFEPFAFEAGEKEINEASYHLNVGVEEMDPRTGDVAEWHSVQKQGNCHVCG